MPPATPSPELIHRARAMYRDGAPVRDIRAATGMSTGTLYYHLDGHTAASTSDEHYGEALRLRALARLRRAPQEEGGAVNSA